MIKLKNKILKDKKTPALPIKKTKKATPPVKRIKKTPASSIKKASDPKTGEAKTGWIALKDLILKHSRVEYFDDRFYKIYLPLNTDPEWLKNVPQNLIEVTPDAVEVFLPSVTTILGKTINKEFLGRWRGDVGNERADKIIDTALLKGSAIHEAIDRLCNGTDILFQNLKTKNISDKEIKAYQKKRRRPVLLIHDQEQMIQLARFKRIIDILQPKILYAEQTVFSLENAYAGTLDQVWEISEATGGLINTDRKRTELSAGLKIIDFKTGNNYDEIGTYIQLSSYYMAHHLKDKITGAIGVHLNSDNKTGIEGVKLFVMNIEMLNYYFEQFQTYRKIYNFNNPVAPKRYEIPFIITYDKKKKAIKKTN